MWPWTQSKDALLVEAVRTEIRAGVEPLARDLVALKEAVARLEKAQQAMYTREVTDLMLDERDKRINTVEKRLDSLQKAFGGLWQNTALKVGAFVALALSLFNLWEALARLMQ